MKEFMYIDLLTKYRYVIKPLSFKSSIFFEHYFHEHTVSEHLHHKFDYYYTIYIFNKCNFRFIFDNTYFVPKSGDVLIITPSTHYFVDFFPSNGVDYIEINFQPDFWDDLFSSCEEEFMKKIIEIDEKKYYSLHLQAFQMQRIREHVISIDSLNKCSPMHNLISFSYVIQILNAIFLSFETNSFYTNPKLPAKLSEAIKYIHSNYTAINNIGEIANHCHITPVYLSRLFKNHMSCTIVEYISNLRISYANRLLRSGKSVAESCYESGFTNYTYFVSKFKQFYGTSPGKIKKQKSNDS